MLKQISLSLSHYKKSIECQRKINHIQSKQWVKKVQGGYKNSYKIIEEKTMWDNFVKTEIASLMCQMICADISGKETQIYSHTYAYICI